MLGVGTRLEHPCPDCQGDMILRESKHGLFYGCTSWPGCDATLGTHPDGTPLGIPMNKRTRRWRMIAHAVFDVLWKSKEMSRGEAYGWMQVAMEMTKDEAHIGNFDDAQCKKLCRVVGVYFDGDTQNPEKQ